METKTLRLVVEPDHPLDQLTAEPQPVAVMPVAYTLVPAKIVRPFGRRLGQKYPCGCPGCERKFVLEDHAQLHCSAKCKKTALKRRRSDLRSAWLGRSAGVDKGGSKDAHFAGFSGTEKALPTPPAYGSAGWDARCEREWALGQQMAAFEASLLSPADRADLAGARGPDAARAAIHPGASIFLSPEADDGQPDERARRRRHEALLQDATDKAVAADRAGTLRTRIAARQALHAAIAAPRGEQP